MTAGRAAQTELHATVERLEHTVDVLRCAVFSGDWVTTRHAAAQIVILSQRIEVGLITVTRTDHETAIRQIGRE